MGRSHIVERGPNNGTLTSERPLSAPGEISHVTSLPAPQYRTVARAIFYISRQLHRQSLYSWTYLLHSCIPNMIFAFVFFFCITNTRRIIYCDTSRAEFISKLQFLSWKPHRCAIHIYLCRDSVTMTIRCGYQTPYCTSSIDAIYFWVVTPWTQDGISLDT